MFQRDWELKNACGWDREFGNGILEVMIIMSTWFFFNLKNYDLSVWLVYIESKILIEGKKKMKTPLTISKQMVIEYSWVTWRYTIRWQQHANPTNKISL